MHQNNLDWQQAKVLMVDDTPQNLDVLRQVLTPEGYRLVFANSGERAIQVALKTIPDLIMLDVMMPGINGFETCRRLKQQAETQHIPVIFITAKSDLDDLVAGFDVGAVDYITKPFRPEEVCVRVRTHVTTQLLIKQQTRLIAEAKAAEHRFRLLATWSPVGIFQSDGESAQVIYANQQWKRISGLASTDHRSWLSMVHPDDLASVNAAWQQSQQQRGDFQAEFRLATSHDAKQSWALLRATPIVADPASADPTLAQSFIGTLEDISAHKRIEARMRQAKDAVELAMREKSDFLASMIYELRTPINAILGYTDLMLGTAENDQDREDLERIGGACRYLLNLINNVMELSKVEAHKMPLCLAHFKLLPLLIQVQAAVTPLVRKNHNTLLLDVGEDLGIMHNDPTKLQQVLTNLLSNACKFTARGTITLGVRRDEDQGQEWVTFAVSDTGIGLSTEQQAKLFQKYSQADDESYQQHDGTGLGLVLSRAFSRLMGGDISVSSSAGQGATFTVKVPARIEQIEID